jgi:peptide/nickel transport system ATP-binding protein
MLLQIENLQTHFFTSGGVVKAVDGVSLEVSEGGTLGIVGESGSGKSVTALSVLKLVSEPGRIVGGRILFKREGETVDLLKLPSDKLRAVRGGRIAMIFQEPMTSLNPVFTIGNQIEEAVALHQKGLSRSARKAKVIESLSLVRVPDPDRVAASYPHELSGGMRQRAMIAMALSCRPELLIADEPTTALDVTIQAQVLALLNELREKLKMALILITHDLGIIAETVDSVAVMYAGKVVETGPTKDLFAAPRHPYTRALLKALPTLKTEGRLQTIPGTVPDLANLPRAARIKTAAKKVQERCRREDPKLEGSGGRAARCFFPYGEGAMNGELLKVSGLVKRFPVRAGFFSRVSNWVKAVSGVSFAVGAGETLGLVGESGCGKTTVARMVASSSSLTPERSRSSKQISRPLKGNSLRPFRRKIQMIFQDPYSSLNPRMRVGEIIAEPW